MPRFRFPIRFVGMALAVACVFHPAVSGSAIADETREIQIRRTPDNVRFGQIGQIGKTPAPTLIVVAHGIEEMQR